MFSLFPTRAIAFVIFGFPVHWYGLLYLAAFLLAWFLLPKLQKFRKLNYNADEWSTILSAAVLGVIVGGRLGFVFFYEPQYFLIHPLEIIQVWHGGMSSHGGFIGVTLALLFVMRKRLSELPRFMDVIVVPIGIGLALGRLGNFINQELYGTVTTLPWGIAVPGVEGLRHPTQFYEMATDLLTALLCYWHLRTSPKHPGETCALFLILYSIFRFSIEFLRVQDYSGIQLGTLMLTRGQILTIPLFLAGLFLLIWARKKSA